MDVPQKQHEPDPAVDRPVESKARRRLRRLGTIVVVALAVIGLIAVYRAFASPPGVGYFRTAEGAAEYRASYDEAMALLPEPTAVHDVDTDYGIVRVYEWLPAGGAADGVAGGAAAADDAGVAGEREDVPVVLLPGRSSGVPMWSENLPGFLDTHRVLALDALGDAGLSVQRAPIESFDDQAVWIGQAIDDLAPAGAHVVGHSFGGASAAAYARTHPERVVSLTLLEPVFTVAQPPAGMLWWAIVASIPGMPEGIREHALGKIGGAEEGEAADESDPIAQMISAGTEHYSADLPTPSPLTTEQAARLTMPVYVAVAGRDSLAGADAESSAAELLPGATVEVWPNATHSLPMQEAAALTPRLAEFWSTAEAGRG